MSAGENRNEPGPLPPWKNTTVIGKPLPRVDGYERVSGAAVYPSDISLPGMLYAAVLRCPYAHAMVQDVDPREAEKTPGVRAVITGKTPGAGVDWSYTTPAAAIKTRLFNSHCRHEGEEVAAVAAETPYQAWEGVRAIKVKYQVLPFVVDHKKALDPQAPAVHECGNRVAKPLVYKRGDVAEGFAEAEVVREETYHTACELHTPLELHGCVARWDGPRLTIWEPTQGVFAVQSVVAQVLGLPLSNVRVIGHYVGGAFGSRLTAGKYDIIAALLAKKTGRPVKLFLTREETYLCVGNRPPDVMKIKAGVKKDGNLTALEYKALGTGGAYPAGGTSNVDWLVRDLYTCPNVRTETTDVFIHAGPARPFRAPGHPQCAWALEQMMDTLAEAIGMDPVELRLKNVPSHSQGRGNIPYTSTGLRQCLEEGARTFGWEEARRKAEESKRNGSHIRRGVGMAGGLWVVGGGRQPVTVVVKLFSDGSVNLNMGASDIGTGTKTVMAMVVAEELEIPLEKIQIENADTGTTQFTTPSGGSKTVPSEAPAVRAAAFSVKQQLLSMAAKELKVNSSEVEWKGASIAVKGNPGKEIQISRLSELKQQGVVLGIGVRGPNPADRWVNPFSAQFCEVEVNMKTGELKVIRFLGTNDSGRVMNRKTFECQVRGGITMGIGFALTEGRVLDGNQTGKMVNRNWHDYKLPTALDVPDDVISLPIEVEDPWCNSAGAKGLGEPATIPTAAALANAVYNATGVRMTSTPISPLKLCQALSAQRGKGK